MQRKYTYIKDFEKELIEYIQQGHTLRKTEEKHGFTCKEMRNFKNHYILRRHMVAYTQTQNLLSKVVWLRKNGTSPPAVYGRIGENPAKRRIRSVA